MSLKPSSVTLRNKLALGTVQFGTPYGVTNRAGQTSHDEAMKTMQLAYEAGVRFFDTARAYGNAEVVVGDFVHWLQAKGHLEGLRIATKLAPLENDSTAGVRAEESLMASLAALGCKSVDVFMYHRWGNARNSPISSAIKRLHKKYNKLGVSVLNIDEASEALRDPNIKFIQLPCNLLDQRPIQAEFQDLRSSRADVEIQLRSVLLQGVLTDNFDASTQKIAGHNMSEVLRAVDDLVVKLKRQNRMDLAYAYALSLNWAQSVVFGVENSQQLRENLKLFDCEPLTAAERQEVAAVVAKLRVPQEVLNPYQWATII